jgi:thymidylate synthase (FAD)
MSADVKTADEIASSAIAIEGRFMAAQTRAGQRGDSALPDIRKGSVVPVELRVDVIAKTEMNYAAMAVATDGAWTLAEDQHSGGEALAEAAGRACFQSWSRPNPNRRTNKAYLAHILEVQHLSIFRHATVTVYVQGISRACANELIRHHVGMDFSQLSQRYVDAKDMDYVIPPAMRGSVEAEDQLEQNWRASVHAYEVEVKRLTTKGKTHKQARETARALLPSCAETRIVVTANLQAWRNFIQQRATIHADAEICALAVEVLQHLQEYAPNVFGDFELLTWVEGPGHDGRTYAYSSVSAPC